MAGKYTIEQVQEIFKEQGCELLSKKYERVHDILEYKCSCGNISKIRLTHFLRGHRCKKCGHEKTIEKLKYSYDEVKNIFKEQNCELLSREYKRFHGILDYKCSCGNISKIRLSHFLSGQRCKKCGIIKMTGENNPCYNHNLTDEDRISRRKIPENEIWRKKVYTKYDFTCQKCMVRGGILNAHHIQNFAEFSELRFAIDNGITFCKGCHQEFHRIYGRRNNTKEQILLYLK